MSTEQANVMVWDRARRGHYEVWFIMASAVAERVGLWIRYTVEAPLHDEPAEGRLWFALTDAADPSRNVALNRGFPVSALATTTAPFEAMIGGGRITHSSATGVVSGGGHKVSWDLSWLPGERALHYLPSFAYTTSLTDTVVLDPSPSSPATGVVEVDGRRIQLAGDPMVQEHLWGRKHAHEWAWAQCNGFGGDRAIVLECLTVRLRRRGVVLPPMTVAVLRIGDEELTFNEVVHLPLNRGDYATGRYRIRALSGAARIEASFRARPEDLVLATYHDPDGEVRYCHNTAVADCDLRLFRRSSLLGFREAGSWHATQVARFETAGPLSDPTVRLRHEAVSG